MSEFTVQFDFNNLTLHFSGVLSHILERAAFTLHAVDSATENPGRLPGVIGPVLPPAVRTHSLEDIRRDVRMRTVRDAMREFVEHLSRFLEETRRLCAAVVLSKHDVVLAEQWTKAVYEPSTRFDRLTLPEKIAKLRADYGPNIVHELIDDISTLNVLRNCLVHRQGVVGAKDCNDGNSLSVRWKYLKIVARAPDGQERDFEPSMRIESGAQLVARQLGTRRLYELGERIVLSEDDLAGIFLTFHFFGQGTAQRVVDFARTHGFIIPTSETADVVNVAVQKEQ